MSQSTFFILSVVVLAAALSWPASRLIWVLSVRRIERRTKTRLTPEEIAGQKRRAWIIAIFCCLLFSYLFNLSTLGVPK